MLYEIMTNKEDDGRYYPNYVCFKKMQLNFDNEHKNRYINLYEKELSVYGFEVKFVN